MNSAPLARPASHLWLAGLLLLLLAPGVIASAAAEGAARISRSIERVDGAGSNEQRAILLDAQVDITAAAPLVVAGGRSEAAATAVAGRRQIAAVPGFRILDARSFLFDDFDRDGFYSRFAVAFDADVDHGFADVYARLYLSYAGGPWNLYHTSDWFVLDTGGGNFEVITELMGGYPSGHYDIMIELYLTGFSAPVAVLGPYQDAGLSALPLESDYRDEAFLPDRDHYGHGAAGIGVAPLLVLGGWLVARRRRQRRTAVAA